jgi:hypothetical protein
MTQMMTQTTTGAGQRPVTSCDPALRVTRSLLGYGVLAGPVYVGVSLAQAVTRDGFDLGRHAWSLLSNGGLGWVQITNFVLTGLMTVAFAAGLHRAPRAAGGGRWAPRLVAVYGAALVVAGLFRADPALGFPPGTPDGQGSVSWHGMLHLGAGGVGFSCLVAACLVVARRFAAEGRRGWAAYSRATGVLFLAGFLAMAGTGGAAGTTVAFTVAAVAAWAWVAALAVHLYRRAGHPAAG